MNQKTSPNLDIPFIASHYDSNTVALRDDHDSVTYCELTKAVQHRAFEWQNIIDQNEQQRPVVILFFDNSITSVIDYLSALSLNYVILLLNPCCSNDTRAAYSEQFNPNAVIENGKVLLSHNEHLFCDPRVSLLLSTSGSMGAGKCVALSHSNIKANCEAILSYLPILPSDNTLLTLPLSYSYGLSVLHTHLAIGATVRFTRHSVFDKGFWQIVKHQPIHSLSGVPTFYEMLLRLRFTSMSLPDLRYLTQAGGKLATAYVTRLAQYTQKTGKAFYVMYGQTEATARMAYLSPDKVLVKPGAIGNAIAGGEFKLVNADSDNGEGELFYRGENVMLGYVSTIQDLVTFSEIDWLATGDLATQDSDGDYTITGRTKRIIKIAGERVNLDLVEQAFINILAKYNLLSHACVVGFDDKVIGVYAGVISAEHRCEVIEHLSISLSLPKRNVAIDIVESLPLLNNGKVDYSSVIQTMTGAG